MVNGPLKPMGLPKIFVEFHEFAVSIFSGYVRLESRYFLTKLSRTTDLFMTFDRLRTWTSRARI